MPASNEQQSKEISEEYLHDLMGDIREMLRYARSTSIVIPAELSAKLTTLFSEEGLSSITPISAEDYAKAEKVVEDATDALIGRDATAAGAVESVADD